MPVDNSQFYHDPLYAANEGMTQRFQPDDPIRTIPGVPDVSQQMGIRIAAARERDRNRMLTVNNPLFRMLPYHKGLKPYINNDTVAQGMQDFMGTGMGQAYLGGDVLGAYDRLIASSPAFHGGHVSNGNLVRMRQTDVRAANWLVKGKGGLMDTIYKGDDGRYTPGGNREATSGLSPEDAINSVTYSAQFNKTAIGGGVRGAKLGDKMKEAKGIWAAVSSVMEVAGTQDFQTTMDAFRKLEGKSFNPVDADRITAKFKKIAATAASLNVSAGGLASIVAGGREAVDARMGWGRGTAFEGGPTSSTGYMDAAMERGAAIIRAKNINNPEEQARVMAQEQGRAAQHLNTRGGRVIDLVTSLKGAGRIDRGLADEILKDISSGGSINKWLPTLNKISRMDVLKTVSSDTAFSITKDQLGQEMVDKGVDVDAVNKESAERMAERFQHEKSMIKNQAKARSGKDNMRELRRQYGITFTKQESARIDADAKKRAMDRIDASDMPDKDKTAAKDAILLGDYNKKSFGEILGDLGRLGTFGKEAAAELERARSDVEYDTAKGRGDLDRLSGYDEKRLVKDYKVTGKTSKERQDRIKAAAQAEFKRLDAKGSRRTETEDALWRKAKTDLETIDKSKTMSKHMDDARAKEEKEGPLGVARAKEAYDKGETPTQEKLTKTSEASIRDAKDDLRKEAENLEAQKRKRENMTPEQLKAAEEKDKNKQAANEGRKTGEGAGKTVELTLKEGKITWDGGNGGQLSFKADAVFPAVWDS